MKKIYTIAVLVILAQFTSIGKSGYLEAFSGFKTKDILAGFTSISSFDVKNDLLYTLDGDTIRIFDLNDHSQVQKFPAPQDRPPFPAFLKVDPTGTAVFLGYTAAGNADDRIYFSPIQTHQWKQIAMFPAHYDLDFWNGNILVSGTNSTDWADSNGIFLLDTTGANNHRKIIDTGGSSAGLAVDMLGNIYFATSSFTEPNKVLKWNYTEVAQTIDDESAVHLSSADAVVLSDIPATASDTHVDQANNLFFIFNDFMGDKVIAMWDGNLDEGENFTTLAIAKGANDWLTYLSSRGNVLEPATGNELFVAGFGRPLAMVYTPRFPLVLNPIGNISGIVGDQIVKIAVKDVFGHPEDESLEFAVSVNSIPSVALVSIASDTLYIEFLEHGQTNIIITATTPYAKEVSTSFVVGVKPVIKGDFIVSDFEDPELGPESFWNGSDLSGGFESGLLFFPNNYNAEWGSWSQWAYSNVSDNTTPGWLNQHSAITGAGVAPDLSGGSNYGVAYSPKVLNFNNPSSHVIKGMFVTNSTYAALSMKHGDAFSKKFGGDDGDDPDWFRLSVWGFRNANPTDTIHFYLADFRFEDNIQDYIVETWQWLGLSSLGKVDSLGFRLSSSDVGAWGMNTPAYFAVDNVFVVPDLAPLVVSNINNITMRDDDNVIYLPLEGVFTDPDDDDKNINISLLEISNDALIEVEINEGTLQVKPVMGQSGTSTITLQALSNGKTVTTSFDVTVESTVNTHWAASQNITVYPNPSHGALRINGLEESGSVSLELFSLDGRLVFSKDNHLSGETIYVNGLPAGTYMIRIFSVDQIHVSRVVLR